jgi:site-specific recombinase XerD
MINQCFSHPAALRHFRFGPLGPHIDGFAALLLDQGYATWTVKPKLRLVAHFDQWLHWRKLGVDELDEQALVRFLRYRKKKGYAARSNQSTLRDLLQYLRDTSATPASATPGDGSPLQQVERSFAQYLIQERGLCKETGAGYLYCVHRFLSERFRSGKILLSKLRAADVNKFIVGLSRAASPKWVQLTATALRAFLRFLHLRGETGTNLAAAIPSVTKWRLSTIPKRLEPAQVKQLLKACDQNNRTGQRDYAILLLLARLGLRAGEVVKLMLDDISWAAGEFIVRGKGPQQDRLPIPQDVGKALATYLSKARPHCSTRRLFVRMHAPYRGLARAGCISCIVKHCLLRAGLNPAHKGAHLLRHSLATEMLRKGASLEEIGEVLRHRHPDSTAIYAKVDLVALRRLTQPWPGGAK